MYKFLMALLLACWVLPAVANDDSAGDNPSAAAMVLGRDPTQPLGYKTPQAGKVAAQALRLSSVLISAQRKLAIINGHSLREGQIIPDSNGVRLVQINTQGVVLAQGKRQWSLRLAPSVIKPRQ